MKPKYDTTVARIAGNILGGMLADPNVTAGSAESRAILVGNAVTLARAIVAEVQRTEPQPVEAPTPETETVSDTRIFAQCPECRWKWEVGTTQKHGATCTRRRTDGSDAS